MSTDAINTLVTSSPLRADASDLLVTPGVAPKVAEGKTPSRSDGPSPPTVSTPELPPDSTTSDSPTGELNGTCESYSDGRAAQILLSNSLSRPEPTSTSQETSAPSSSLPDLPSSTVDHRTDVPERPVIATVNGASNKPVRRPTRSLHNLDQIVKKLTTVQNGHKTEPQTPSSDRAALDLTTKIRMDPDDGPVKAVKWDIMKKKGARDPKRKPLPAVGQMIPNQQVLPMSSENFPNPVQLLRIPQYIPQSQTDPNKGRSELRLVGLTGGATVVTHHSMAAQTTPDDKKSYDKRFEVRPTALVNPFPGGEASSSRAFPSKAFAVEGYVAKGTQMEGDVGRPVSKNTQICVPNGAQPLWTPVEPELGDLEKKRYHPVPIVGPKKRRDRPTKVSNFHKLAASLVTTAPSAMPIIPGNSVGTKPATMAKPMTLATTSTKPPSTGLSVTTSIMASPVVSASTALAVPPASYPLQPPFPTDGVRGAAKRKRIKNVTAPVPSVPAPQMSSVGQQTIPIQTDLPVHFVGQPHLLATPGQPHPLANSGQTRLPANIISKTPDFSVANMLGGSGGAVSITPLDVNRTVSSPVTDQAVVDRLKRLGTVIEVEEELNFPADKETIVAPSALKMLEKMTIDPPQSPVVSALDDRPMFLGKDISLYPKKKGTTFLHSQKHSPLSIIPVGTPSAAVGVLEPVKSSTKELPLPNPVPHLPLLTITKAGSETRPAAVPQPVVTVTKTASTSTVSDTPESEPPLTLLEPVIVLDEDDLPKDGENPLADGFFVFRHDSTLSVELPNDQKVFSCDICSAAFHHLHMLRKHYFRLHVARKYISEKDLEAYNIDPEKCDDSNDEFIYRCHTCRRCLPTKTELKSHLTDHPPVADLAKHIKGAKDYKCEKCNAHFKWRKMFGKHKRNCRLPIGNKIEGVKKLDERDSDPSDESPVKDQAITSVTELALRQVIDIRSNTEPVTDGASPRTSAPAEMEISSESLAIGNSKLQGLNEPNVPEVVDQALNVQLKPEVKRQQRSRNSLQQSKPQRRTRQTVAMAVHSPPELPEECLKVPDTEEPLELNLAEQCQTTDTPISSINQTTPPAVETVSPPNQPATCDGECQTNFDDPVDNLSVSRIDTSLVSELHQEIPERPVSSAGIPGVSSNTVATAGQVSSPQLTTSTPGQPEPLSPSAKPSDPTNIETCGTQNSTEAEKPTLPGSTATEPLIVQTPADIETKNEAATESKPQPSTSLALSGPLAVLNDKSASKGLHHCLYCNETFSNGHKKRNHHVREHPYVRKNHPCVFCKNEKKPKKDVFVTPSALFAHLLTAHPTVYFVCVVCKERFHSLEELRRHSSSRHTLDKDEQKELDSRTSDVPDDASSFTCTACSRMWLFKTCMAEHKCNPDKDKPSNTEKLQAGRSKLRKVKVMDRLERIDKPMRVDPETIFYSQVALNVRNNLLHFLDGKVPQDEEEDEVEDVSVKVPERNTLNFSAGFPSSAGLQLIEEPEPYSRVKAQWEKYSFPKNYDGRCGLTSYIKDMSYLDISTQLIMRRNLQRLQGTEVTSPSTSDDVPSSLALERLATQCAESFGINGIPGSNDATQTLGELSGEWVRDRIYICSVCSWETPCLWSMEDHKYEFHPQVLCPQHELVGDQRCLTDTIYKRLVGGSDALLTPDRPNLRPLSITKIACTKCGMDGWASRTELHIHILACAGEPIPQWAPTPRKRRWPKKRRRPRRGLKRNIPSTPHRPIKVRTKPGDTDTIQKMIANLPAKRSTRRVIGFDDDVKTRSQSTIQNCPVLLPSNRLVLPPSNHHKLSKGSQRASPRPKELIYAPIPKETDHIDTSAERGDVLSSLRMMPVSTPREELLEPRQIIDKVINQKVLGHSVDDPAIYQCTGCGETLESKVILRKHQKSCAYFRECGPNAEHKCKVCSNRFENLVALIEHSCEEMPKLEIEEDLSPVNSADIPVLSPVRNEGKKLDGSKVTKIDDGSEHETNLKRKRSHSLGDLTVKKIFRPGHRRSARLGHAESGPLDTTEQSDKLPEDSRAVSDSEDTSDLSQARNPNSDKNSESTEKQKVLSLPAGIKTTDVNPQSPAVKLENVDDDSLWEKQAVVDEEEELKEEKTGDHETEDPTMLDTSNAISKRKPKKFRRPKRLTMKKKGRWVPKGMRQKTANSTNKKEEPQIDSKVPDDSTESSELPTSQTEKADDLSAQPIEPSSADTHGKDMKVSTSDVSDQNGQVEKILNPPEHKEEDNNVIPSVSAKPPVVVLKPKNSKGKITGAKAKLGGKKASLAVKTKPLGKIIGKSGKLKVRITSKIRPIVQPEPPSADDAKSDIPKVKTEPVDNLARSIDAVANGTAQALKDLFEKSFDDVVAATALPNASTESTKPMMLVPEKHQKGRKKVKKSLEETSKTPATEEEPVKLDDRSEDRSPNDKSTTEEETLAKSKEAEVNITEVKSAKPKMKYKKPNLESNDVKTVLDSQPADLKSNFNNSVAENVKESKQRKQSRGSMNSSTIEESSVSLVQPMLDDPEKLLSKRKPRNAVRNENHSQNNAVDPPSGTDNAVETTLKTRSRSKSVPSQTDLGKSEDGEDSDRSEVTDGKPPRRSGRSLQRGEEAEMTISGEAAIRVTRRSKKDVSDPQIEEPTEESNIGQNECTNELTLPNATVQIETGEPSEECPEVESEQKETVKNDSSDDSAVDVNLFYSGQKKGAKKGLKQPSKIVDKPDIEEEAKSEETIASDVDGTEETAQGIADAAGQEPKLSAEEPEKPKPKNKLLSGRLPSAVKAAALLSRKPLHQIEPNPVEDAKKRKVLGLKTGPAKRLTRSNSNGKEAKTDGIIDPYDYNEDEIVPFQEPRYKPYSPPKPVLYTPPVKRRARKREASPDTTTIVVQAEVHPEPLPRRRANATTSGESPAKRKSPSADYGLNAPKKTRVKACYDGIDVIKDEEDSSSPPLLVPAVKPEVLKSQSPLRTMSPVQLRSSRGSTPVGVRSPTTLASPTRVASPARRSPALGAPVASPVAKSPARVSSPARVVVPSQSPARVASPKTSPTVASPARGSPARVASPSLGLPGRDSPMRTTLPLRSYGRPPKAPSPPCDPPELIDESKVKIEEKLDPDSSSPILEPSAGPLSDLFDFDPPALEPTNDLPVLTRNLSISGEDTETTLDTEEDTDSQKSFKLCVRKKTKDFLLKKKKKQLLRIKALRNKKKKDIKRNIIKSSGKEVVKIAGFSWEVSDLKTSPVKSEPKPPSPKPSPVPTVPTVVPSLVKDWDAPDIWDSPIVPSAPAPTPVVSSPPIRSDPRPTIPSMPPVSSPAPRSTRSDSSASSNGPVFSLGPILDSVNKLLNEPESFSQLPSHYNLADLQKAMGASDDEMAILQQLGEAQLSLQVAQGYEEPTVISQPLSAEEEWGPMIMDLDNQAAQQPVVSSSVSGSPRRSPSVEPPPLSQPTTSAPMSLHNRSLRDDISNLLKSSSMCKSLRMSPKCSSSTSLLAAHNNKEVVCPTCSRHFMGFPALQIHVNKVHGSTHDSAPVTGGLQNRRVVLETVKNSARLVCFECQQILPSQLMPQHLKVDHELEPSDISRCSTITGESHEGPVVGERLKSKMSSALGDLLDKAFTNLLQVKAKPQIEQAGLAGGAVELLNKLCAIRKRDSANRFNSKDMSFNKLKSDYKTDDDAFLTRVSSERAPAPFICSVCGQRFPIAASRNKHEVLAHRSFGTHEMVDLNLKKDDFSDDEDWRDAPSPTGLANDDDVGNTPSGFFCSDCGLSFNSVPELLKHRKEDHAQRRRESTASDGPAVAATPDTSTRLAAPDTSTVEPAVPDSSTTPPTLPVKIESRSQSLDNNFLTGDIGDGAPASGAGSSRPSTPSGSPPTKRKRQQQQRVRAAKGQQGAVKAQAVDALKLLDVNKS